MQLPISLSVVFGSFTLVTIALMVYNSKNVIERSRNRKSSIKMLILIGILTPVSYFIISHLSGSKNWELIMFKVFAVIWGVLLLIYLYETFRSKLPSLKA